MVKTRDIKIPVLSVELICDPLARQPLSYAMDKYPHLARLDLADPSGPTDHLDNYWRLVTGEIVQHENCPTAIKTHVSWVLSGPLDDQVTQHMHVAFSLQTMTRVQSTESTADLNSVLTRFWDLETMGIQEKEKSLYTEFVQAISFHDGPSSLERRYIHHSLQTIISA